jgi:transketolase
MLLSYKAIRAIKHVLSFSGEKEMNPQGIEVSSVRRLNGEESAQRRHFFKASKEFSEKKDEEEKAILDSQSFKIEQKKAQYRKDFPIKDLETEELFTKRLDEFLNKDAELKEVLAKTAKDIEVLNNSKTEVAMEDSTYKVVKKYFKDFSEKSGFSADDDDVVEELTDVLSIAEWSSGNSSGS